MASTRAEIRGLTSAMEPRAITVVLADDHIVVQMGFRRMLEQAPGIEVLEVIGTGEAACDAYVRLHPDVVVMDLSMPGIGGLEAAHRILEHDNNARILVLSIHANEVLLQRCLDTGVLGYLTKTSNSETVIGAIRKVAKGKKAIGEDMLELLASSRSSGDNSSIDSLSKREFEVFRLLARGKTIGEIASTLDIASKTAHHHFTAVKRKLDAHTSAELANIAFRYELI